MTKNYEDLRENNESYEKMMEMLEETEKRTAEKFCTEAVIPDREIYETAFAESRQIGNEWRPDARSLSRKEIYRRKAEDRLNADGANVVNIDITAIRPNRSQPRAHFESNATIRLADSIRRYGILQPLTVRLIYKENDSADEPKFEIIAGERRFRAAKMLGMKSVPCIMITADDKKSAELALIENLLREDLNIFETARAIKKLIDNFKLTQEEVAKKLSMSQSAVANKLRLLRYTEEEEKLILENHLTERHARALLKLPEPRDRIKAINVVIRAHMNVNATEAYIEKLLEEDITECESNNMRKIPIIKDIRLFYNSLDRALEIVKSAGVEISSKKREDDNGVTIEINIPHPRRAG
ncbi:MAG: ParB/RepB/Spo0J family partition protein [Clostridia bacterium]|nr:ParB/RepB/Spo0J family partition protein [Clostridia bacterium]